jgi:hypothetical protein
MKPADSPSAFASFAQSNGVAVARCTPRDGITQMLAFYSSVSPQACGGPDGDMLLFQWGTCDWGTGKHFELNITRQFIEQELEDDDAISQLGLTFRYIPTQDGESLGDGNRWCHAQTELKDFRADVLSTRAFTLFADAQPLAVELTHSYV